MKRGRLFLIIALVLSFLTLAAGSTLIYNQRVTFEKGITLGAVTLSKVGAGTLYSTAYNRKITEYGDGIVHKTKIDIAETFSFDDVAGASASAYKKLYDFPAGSLVILGALVDTAWDVSGTGTVLGVNADGDISLGTAAADTTSSLSGTEVDIIASTTVAQLVASIGPATARSTAVTYHDGTSTAKDLYLNVLFDDADSSDDTTAAKLTGTVTVYWMNLGDY